MSGNETAKKSAGAQATTSRPGAKRVNYAKDYIAQAEDMMKERMQPQPDELNWQKLDPAIRSR